MTRKLIAFALIFLTAWDGLAVMRALTPIAIERVEGIHDSRREPGNSHRSCGSFATFDTK